MSFRSDIERYRVLGARGPKIRLILENQGLWALACYRFGNSLSRKRFPSLLWRSLKIIYFIWNKSIEMAAGISISPDAKIGPGLYIGHFGQIFIGSGCVLGENCNISQGVTIGLARRGGNWGVPSIGDRVYIAPGAKVIGPITIGNDCVIGANAVMSRNAPDSSVWAGVPARLIGWGGSKDFVGNVVVIEK